MNVLLSVLKRESRRGSEGGKKGEGKNHTSLPFPWSQRKEECRHWLHRKLTGRAYRGFSTGHTRHSSP
jgi:hypothetical protein